IVSKASEDLPEPESPVNTTSLSRGIVRSMFLRLCSRAPRIFITRSSKRFSAGPCGGKSCRDFSRPGADAGKISGAGPGVPERVTRPELADGFGVFIDPVGMRRPTAPGDPLAGRKNLAPM